MALYGIERVLSEVKVALVAGLPAKLTALAAEYADSVALPAPDTATGYYCEPLAPDPKADLLGLTAPAALIFPLSQTPTEPDIGNGYAMSYAFVVATLCQAADKHTMGLLLMRYLRAIAEVLSAAQALPCGDCYLADVDWRARDLTPSDADYTRQAVLAAFVVRTIEQVST